MKKGIIGVFIISVTILALSAPAYAGWVEVDSHSGTTYISGGKLKNVPEDKSEVWSVLDVNKGTITMVNPVKMSYTEFDVDNFCDEMKAMMDGMMSGMPQEQRAMMEQMMVRGKAARANRVTVVKSGGGGKVAGYDTDKYSISVNNRPYKDVWLAANAPIVKDVRDYIKSAIEISRKMESCTQIGPGAQGPAPETSDEYMGLMEKGWMMKELNRQSGEVEAEVTRLEKKSIPASEFIVPAGYKKVSMKDMIGGMKDMMGGMKE